MGDIYGRNDRFYCAKQTAYGTIRNTGGGTASVAAGDACKHRPGSFKARAARTRLAASDVEATAYRGFLDRTRRGRQGVSTASVSPLFTTGSGAGVAPDFGCLLESLLGKETIVEATSVTYGPSGTSSYLDEAAPVTCELWHFNSSGKRGQVAFGALANALRLQFGGDGIQADFDFLCYNVLNQDRFANVDDALEKGGLTAWPTEPASQTYTGSEMSGFTGLSTVDGGGYTTIRNGTLSINMNRGYRTDRFHNDGSQFFPENPFEGVPEFLLDLSLWSQTAAGLDTLIGKLEARTPFDVAIVLGVAAGRLYTINLNNLILPDAGPGWEEGLGDDRKTLDLRGLRAQGTSTAVRDECTVVLT